MDQTEIDPQKLFQAAPDVLARLAALAQAVITGWASAPPSVRAAAGDAVAMIVKLQKDVDGGV